VKTHTLSNSYELDISAPLGSYTACGGGYLSTFSDKLSAPPSTVKQLFFSDCLIVGDGKDRFSGNVCNETNLMYYLSSVYSVTIPRHVSGLLAGHHQ
jgi:hypothetical protein